MAQVLWKMVLHFLVKLVMDLPYSLAVPLLRNKCTPGDGYKNDCNSLKVKWVKDPSIAEWINCDIIT